MLVPTAVAGDMLPKRISNGVKSEPLPIPVKPISSPTSNPIPIMVAKCKILGLGAVQLTGVLCNLQRIKNLRAHREHAIQVPNIVGSIIPSTR